MTNTTRSELFEWLDTCPTQWFMHTDDVGHIAITFVVDEDPEEGVDDDDDDDD